jgi:uncharacterized protein YbaR (Trm112 family)
MPLNNDLLAILLCPETRAPLRAAPSDVVERLNRAIAAGVVRNRGGDEVQTPVVGALLREDGKYFYPIVEDIPILLTDEAILAEPFLATPTHG